MQKAGCQADGAKCTKVMGGGGRRRSRRGDVACVRTAAAVVIQSCPAGPQTHHATAAQLWTAVCSPGMPAPRDQVQQAGRHAHHGHTEVSGEHKRCACAPLTGASSVTRGAHSAAKPARTNRAPNSSTTARRAEPAYSAKDSVCGRSRPVVGVDDRPRSDTVEPTDVTPPTPGVGTGARAAMVPGTLARAAGLEDQGGSQNIRSILTLFSRLCHVRRVTHAVLWASLPGQRWLEG